MFLNVRNPKDPTKNLSDLINEFSKVPGHKVNTQKSVAFLFMNNEKSEKKLTKTITFIAASKRRKYLGINLTKEVKDLYSENYKILPKEIKEDINKWKHILCSWIERLKVVRMPKLPKAI